MLFHKVYDKRKRASVIQLNGYGQKVIFIFEKRCIIMKFVSFFDTTNFGLNCQ